MAKALLPTYTAVPVDDLVWGNPYFYACPGVTGDYDLISYGADGQPDGTDKDADLSANCEASLTATWYEYTPRDPAIRRDEGDGHFVVIPGRPVKRMSRLEGSALRDVAYHSCVAARKPAIE